MGLVVEHAGHRLTYRCTNGAQLERVTTALTKEPGTVAWIANEIRPDDVVADVGANIGIYTVMMAASATRGRVYAFEPHAANVAALLANVARNRQTDRVTAVTSALHDRDGWFDFHYAGLATGSAMSQLDRTKDDHDRELQPVASELKHATTLDAMVASRVMERPDVVKIDVDGNEPAILRGMEQLLTGPKPPRSVQVEVGPGNRAEVGSLMEGFGWALQERHETSRGQAMLDAGADPELTVHNRIYRRADQTT